MSAGRMHDDEIDVGLSLVRQLIDAQFPQWQGLAISPLSASGTDNAIFRLGEDMAVRLPRRPAAAEQIDKESRWLPLLAPHLPLGVPLPLALGVPASAYPYNWAVCRWLEGHNAIDEPVADLNDAASTLAHFITALQAIDATNGPVPGTHNFYRGVPLQGRDRQCRDAIARLGGIIDTGAASKAWQAALDASVWSGQSVWIHGDIHAGNLLVEQGRINGVIDFGGLGVGDPACDLMVAWNLLTAEARVVFRSALSTDDATWARGRGWALSMALIALPYYLDTNPVIVRASRHAIEQVLSDR